MLQKMLQPLPTIGTNRSLLALNKQISPATMDLAVYVVTNNQVLSVAPYDFTISTGSLQPSQMKIITMWQ